MQGSVLLEVVIVLSVMTILVLGVVQLSVYNIRTSRMVLDETQAVYLAEEGIEIVKLLRDDGWAIFADTDRGTSYYLTQGIDGWEFSSTPVSTGDFSRTITIYDVERDISDDIAVSGTADEQTLRVVSSVSWSHAGSTVERSFSTYITDFLTD